MGLVSTYKRLDYRLRGKGWYRAVSNALPRLPRRPAPAVEVRDAASFASDPFASVWTPESRARIDRLCGQVLDAADGLGIALFPFAGTLIGLVREGDILPWDDDMDFALFEPEREQELQRALMAAGLRVHEHRSRLGWFLKVHDPAYAPIARRRWTWPFLDILVYARTAEAVDGKWPRFPVPAELLLPGQKAEFQGHPCRMPAQPLAVLDAMYPGWREVEMTGSFNHRMEWHVQVVARRPVTTDASGRKVSGGGP